MISRGLLRVFGVLTFSAADALRRPKKPLRSLQDGPFSLQDSPKTAHGDSKTAQVSPKTALESPKTPSGRPYEGEPQRTIPAFGLKIAPRAHN